MISCDRGANHDRELVSFLEVEALEVRLQSIY